MEERRRNIRWDIEKPVRFRVDDQILEHKGVSKDISAGGLCLYAKRELTPQTPLDLEIEVPDDLKRIFVRGKVTWNQKVEADTETAQGIKTGVSFLDLKTQDAERIFRYAFKHQHDKLMQHWWEGL